MTKAFDYLLAITSLILLSSGTGTAVPQKPKAHRNANGTWNLDLTKSEFGEAPKPKSAYLTILVKGKSLSWISDVVETDGNHVKQSFDGAMDGKEYSVRTEPDAGNVTASCLMSKDGTTHATLKSSTGRTEMIISVSPDGKALFIKIELTDKSGEKLDWSEVWKRT
jgi:hypothetical protein